MRHIFEQKVFFGDTDAYGMVWHGTYLRWMEAGRILWCDETGNTMSSLKEQDIALPVVNINIRYKSSAKLDDVVVIETWLEKYSSLSATFKQEIKSKETGKIYTSAEVDVVAVHNDGKLYRRFPELLTQTFERTIECPQLV